MSPHPFETTPTGNLELIVKGCIWTYNINISEMLAYEYKLIFTSESGSGGDLETVEGKIS